MSDIEEMKNKANEAAQRAQGQGQIQDQDQDLDLGEQEDESTTGKTGSKMDGVKKKMDVTGDGKVGADDVKQMGEDAVNKVKGMFKKD